MGLEETYGYSVLKPDQSVEPQDVADQRGFANVLLCAVHGVIIYMAIEGTPGHWVYSSVGFIGWYSLKM